MVSAVPTFPGSVAAGLNILTISIGHASPAITLNVYSHMFSDTDTRAAEIMEATFAEVPAVRNENDFATHPVGDPVAVRLTVLSKYLK